MIYELRVYRVVQGRMAALLTRFEHQTLPIMVRHGIQQVGFWTTISQLRKKVEDDPANPTYLLTDSYIGYRFRE